MAKQTTLKERGTGEVMYPQTLASLVKTSTGGNVENALAAKQDALTTSDDLSISADNKLSLTDMAKKRLFIDMWNSLFRLPVGTMSSFYPVGHYDEQTDRFTLGNFSVDYADALETYRAYSVVREKGDFILAGFWWLRIAPPIITAQTTFLDFNNAFTSCRQLKVAAVGGYYDELQAKSLTYAFYGCTQLEEVIGIVNIYNCSATEKVRYAFGGCQKLREIKLKSLHVDISFADSPLLSLASLQYLVANAANTAVITVTVHKDVYAKLTGDTTNEAAGVLTEEEEAAWQQVLADAVEKNIIFATA